MDDEGVMSLALFTSLITSLDLSCCIYVSDERLKALAPLTGLTSLALGGCEYRRGV
jgi:hypothetical protein